MLCGHTDQRLDEAEAGKGAGGLDAPLLGPGGEASPKSTPPARRKTTAMGRLLNDSLYGIINTIVGIPTMISFAAIIFQVCLCVVLLAPIHRNTVLVEQG